MRNVFKLVLLLVASCSIFGCAHNYYSIPQETLEKRVKVVGVAPIFTDADSDIRHPDKSGVVALVETYNARNEKEFLARLRSSGMFYAVRQVEGDPNRLFTTVVASRERRDDAGIIYNKYFYSKDAVKQLMAENGLDAILFLTVSGLTKPDKVYSSNYLSYLDTDFNYLSMTGQMVDRDGNVIWEYPNFKTSALSYPMFFALQYPDFDEATANLSEKVDVKFKTVPGISNAFARTEPSAANGPPVSSLYAAEFSRMLSLLKKYRPLFGKNEAAEGPLPAPVAAPTSTTTPAATPRPVNVPAAPAAAAPPAEPKAVLPQAQPVAPAAPSEEIVPEQPLAPGDIVPEKPAK